MNDAFVLETFRLRVAIVNTAALVENLIWCPRPGTIGIDEPLSEQRRIEQDLVLSIRRVFESFASLAAIPDPPPLRLVPMIKEAMDKVFWCLPDVGPPPSPEDAGSQGSLSIWYDWMQPSDDSAWGLVRFQGELYRSLALLGSGVH